MAEKPNQVVVATGRAGASLATFIPTNMDEVKRMAQWAAVGGMAPRSLTEGKGPEAATAACAIAIMAGAELGLTPMMALRSYAVVNGRPTLWGDGLIAVVLKSPVYKQGSLRKGYDAEKKVGWCEAERDDGTKWREEFTEAQAKRANLLSKKGPWQEYPDVMMTRRAISKCLNFLFADVLGGFVTEDEAYEMVDVSPRRIDPPDVPDVPASGSTIEGKPASVSKPAEGETQVGAENAHTAADAAGDYNDDASGVSREAEPANVDAWITRLDEELSAGSDEATLTEIWDNLSPETALAGNDEALQRAFDTRKRHVEIIAQRAEIKRQGEIIHGSGDMFPPDVPE